MAEHSHKAGVVAAVLLVCAGGTTAAAATPTAAGEPRRASRAAQVVQWEDAYDDARATGDLRQVQTSSRDDRDVLRMRFVAGPLGVTVEMVLLGEASGPGYYGVLTDPTTGCALRVALTGDETATVVCRGVPSGTHTALGQRSDAPSLLRAFVAYDDFPRGVDPSRQLRVSGETWDSVPFLPPPPPVPPPFPEHRRVWPSPGVDVHRLDVATTGATLTRGRR